MTAGIRSTLARAWDRDTLASPLLAAAAIAWVAVWLITVGQLGAQNPALAWPARAALVLFMLSFLLSATCSEAGGRLLRDLGYIGQLLAIFGLFALGRSGSTGILMVLFVTTFTLRFSTRLELALLGLFNASLFGIITWHWGMKPQAALTVMMAWYGTCAAMTAWTCASPSPAWPGRCRARRSRSRWSPAAACRAPSRPRSCCASPRRR